MRSDRLNTLADFLETEVPAKKFSMSSWCFLDDPSITIPQQVSQIECGFAACAWGWATAVPEFFAAGVHLDSYGDDVVYNGQTGTNAAADFFDIDRDTAIYLFMPTEYPVKRGKPSLKAVAKRLREVASGDTRRSANL